MATAAQIRQTIDTRAEQQMHRFAQMVRGVTPRVCPICNYRGMFTPFGMPPRIDAHCAGCGSLERHRLYALMITRDAPFKATDRVLHFSAEHHLRKLVRPRVASYETAELRASTNPDHVLDIEAIAMEDGCFDKVIVNHVLEHVNDAKALAEVFRILVPGGTAFFTTPVIEGWATSYENLAVTGSADRVLHFGQHDHVRLYGADLRDRIRAAGFALREVTAEEPDVHRHGLLRGEKIFVATKPGGN
ncbi:MAG: methyltransferase domain-containing protein [Paracoccaceae bacterium]|jgi:SAM-dependent methyltransferase|nr:methyltransferase domain-containing protein [Paracoccaceae bacterium]